MRGQGEGDSGRAQIRLHQLMVNFLSDSGCMDDFYSVAAVVVVFSGTSQVSER